MFKKKVHEQTSAANYKFRSHLPPECRVQTAQTLYSRSCSLCAVPLEGPITHPISSCVPPVALETASYWTSLTRGLTVVLAAPSKTNKS